MIMGRRAHVSLLAILTGLLVLPAGAIAKEVSAAKICGAEDCVRAGDEDIRMALASGGPPTSGPERGLPWYRSTLTFTVPDPNARAEYSTLAVVPRARVLRAGDGTWISMSPEAAKAYAKLTAGLRPRPARTLPGVGPDAALPEARVDEVVQPPTPTGSPDEQRSSGWVAWLIAGLAALAATGVLVAVASRRLKPPRRAGSPGRWRRGTARAR